MAENPTPKEEMLRVEGASRETLVDRVGTHQSVLAAFEAPLARLAREHYTEDTFFGILWRWEYARQYGVYGIQDIQAFCLRCGKPMAVQSFGEPRVSARTIYRCERCSDSGYRFVGQDLEVKERVRQKILEYNSADSVVRRPGAVSTQATRSGVR